MSNRNTRAPVDTGLVGRANRIVVALLLSLLPFAATAQSPRGQFYVLDAFGGVHAGGGAPAITPATPYFGFDAAQDVAYIPQGSAAGHGEGIVVLDIFGGVHVGGALTLDPPMLTTPYFGFRAARAIVYRDIPARASGDSLSTSSVVYVATLVPYLATLMDAPDDGYLIVSGSIQIQCSTAAAGWAGINVGLALDGTTPANVYTGVVPDCSVRDFETVAMTHMFPVDTGRHTVNLVVGNAGGTVNPTVSSRDLSVIYVDQTANGGS